MDSVGFWANGSKLCGNCRFPQNFHTRESGEVTVFCAVLRVAVFFFGVLDILE